jgi:hypothetical protein
VNEIAGVVMKSIRGKMLSWILITVNAFAMFELAGMPKMYINEFHFHDARLPQKYELTEAYIPREDMTFRSVEGENISVPAGSRIYRKINYIEFVRAQIDAAMDNKAEPKIDDYFEICVGEKGPKLDVSRAVFYDREKFEDISGEVRNEIYNDYREKREEEDKEYRQYLFRQHFWMFFPQNYSYGYKKGLTFGLIAAVIGIMVCLLKRERYLAFNIIYLCLTGIKIAGIIFVLMFPATCA